MALNIFLSFLLAIGAIGAVIVICAGWNKLYDKLVAHYIEKGLCLYDAKECATGSIVMVFLVAALTGLFFILLSEQ